VDAAGCIGDSVKAYTALHYLGRLSSGDTGEVVVFVIRSLNPEDSKLLGSTRKKNSPVENVVQKCISDWKYLNCCRNTLSLSTLLC
jgi:hypothetical protein